MEKVEVTERLIHIPVREPAEFVDGSFRTIDISQPRGVRAVIGKLKSDPGGPTKVQKYTFDKSKWTLQAAQEWVKQNKTMEPNERKYLKAYVEKSEEDGTLSVAVASDSGEDRDGEKILAEGWDFSDFKKNPVLLWAHDYRQPPIGKVIEVKKEGDRVLFRPKFAVEASEKAREIFRLYKEGYLNAFSVGFQPKERDGNTFTKASLMEISAVPVPSNPRALVLARSMKSQDGKETDHVLKDLIGEMEKAIDETSEKAEVRVRTGESDGHTHMAIFDDETGNGRTEEADGHAHAIRDFRVQEADGHRHSLPRRFAQSTETKGAIPYSVHGDVSKAPNDAPWDGQKQASSATIEQLAFMATWVDSENRDTKQAYKLPHHRTDKTVVFRGVVAAMAGLLGARGGVDIPAGDRKSVYEHLARHYKQFDREPPEFRLVETQALKNIDDDILLHALSKDLSADTGNERKGTKGSGSSVDHLDGLVAALQTEAGTKRVLQVIDKHIGLALKAYKGSDTKKP